MPVFEWARYVLDFKFEARTSRDTLLHKQTYFIRVHDEKIPGVYGYGEAPLFKGLSEEDSPDYEKHLSEACRKADFDCRISSVLFGMESALTDLYGGGKGILFPSNWTEGIGEIPINGLVWMGDYETMLNRIRNKINEGFGVIKLKIGGISFENEIKLLEIIREEYGTKSLEIRLDANGSFDYTTALEKLERLAKYDIHSIEQPLRAGNIREMAQVCKYSPIPVALDEELIGWKSDLQMSRLLDDILPSFIILKPALCGGFQRASKWIEYARERSIGWWATSALESNIGLNAIAQWVYCFKPAIPQGLGTGELYYNNIPSPIERIGSRLKYNPSGKWKLPENLQWLH